MLVQMESSLVGLHSKGCRMVFCMLWHKFVDQNRWKVDGKNCEIYADLIFVCGRSPIWRTNTWNVCVLFHFSLGNPTFPQDLGSPPPPPAVFSRRAKRPWNPSSLRIITPGTSGSFGGVEAVDSDGVQLRRCGYKFEKRNSCMMEIEDIEKWWNDEFFPQVHGVLFVFCEASQTTSHQLRVPALERTRRCCNLRTTWNTIRHWTILRLGKRKDSTSNLLLDDWNSSGRIRAFVSTMFRLVKSVRCAGSLTFTG